MRTRICAVAAAVLLPLLLVACDGDGPDALTPRPEADPPPEPARRTDGGEGATHASEAELVELEREIELLEGQCVPAKGVARAIVEARFGEGQPAFNSKIPGVAPPDSPYRAYEFSAEDVLRVRYDDEWNVSWAHYHDPHSTKGAPIGRAPPPGRRERELRLRLAQMTRIRKEYRARFGE